MKQKVSPVVAVVAILVVAAAAFGLVWVNVSRSPQGSQAGQAPPPMPPDVMAEMQKRGGNITGPPKANEPSTSGGIQGMGRPPGL